MIWFNKDKSTMIDLDKVASYQYYPEHETAGTVYPSSLTVNCQGKIFLGAGDAEIFLELIKNKLKN